MSGSKITVTMTKADLTGAAGRPKTDLEIRAELRRLGLNTEMIFTGHFIEDGGIEYCGTRLNGGEG